MQQLLTAQANSASTYLAQAIVQGLLRMKKYPWGKKRQSHCVHIKPFTCTRARSLFHGRMTHKWARKTTRQHPGPGWSWEIAICQLCFPDDLATNAATLLHRHTAGTGWQGVSFRTQITAVNWHCSFWTSGINSGQVSRILSWQHHSLWCIDKLCCDQTISSGNLLQ